MKISRFRSIPSLRQGKNQHAGRNNKGRITIRHRGRGHKQNVRHISWAPSSNTGVVVGFEYDPQRTTPLAKIYHPTRNEASSEEKTFSYQIATSNSKLFQSLNYTDRHPNAYGDQSKLINFEAGDFVHSVELYPGQGPSIARSAGSYCQVRSSFVADTKYLEKPTSTGSLITGSEKLSKTKGDDQFVKIRLPSGAQRLVSSNSNAVYGIPAFSGFHQKPRRKAGRTRWYGWRPSVRGVARNPVDHPHGGGQGKTSGGRPSVTFKAWPTKGQPTRSPKRKNSFMLEPRKKKN